MTYFGLLGDPGLLFPDEDVITLAKPLNNTLRRIVDVFGTFDHDISMTLPSTCGLQTATPESLYVGTRFMTKATYAPCPKFIPVPELRTLFRGPLTWEFPKMGVHFLGVLTTGGLLVWGLY